MKWGNMSQGVVVMKKPRGIKKNKTKTKTKALRHVPQCTSTCIFHSVAGQETHTPLCITKAPEPLEVLTVWESWSLSIMFKTLKNCYTCK